FAAWFLANLAFAAAVPSFRRRGLLAEALTWSVSLGAPVVAYGCWLSGGAEWLGLSALSIILLMGTLSLPKKSSRKVYAVCAAVLAAYLGVAFAGIKPSQAMLPPQFSSLDLA